MKARKTLNKPLLRKLALKLRRLRHEKHYEQEVWAEKTACGTAACVAGHAILAAGGKLNFTKPEWEGDYVAAKSCTLPGSPRPRNIAVAAKEILGFGRSNTSLFSSSPDEYWPEPYRSRWEAAKYDDSGERLSRIAADFLDAIADGKVKP